MIDFINKLYRFQPLKCLLAICLISLASQSCGGTQSAQSSDSELQALYEEDSRVLLRAAAVDSEEGASEEGGASVTFEICRATFNDKPVAIEDSCTPAFVSYEEEGGEPVIFSAKELQQALNGSEIKLVKIIQQAKEDFRLYSNDAKSMMNPAHWLGMSIVGGAGGASVVFLAGHLLKLSHSLALQLVAFSAAFLGAFVAPHILEDHLDQVNSVKMDDAAKEYYHQLHRYTTDPMTAILDKEIADGSYHDFPQLVQNVDLILSFAGEVEEVNKLPRIMRDLGAYLRAVMPNGKDIDQYCIYPHKFALEPECNSVQYLSPSW